MSGNAAAKKFDAQRYIAQMAELAGASGHAELFQR
jgi:hypothetical protein